MKSLCAIVLALVVVGCQQQQPTVDPPAEKLPTFQSIPVNDPGIVEVAKQIDFDLSGTWNVSRFGTKLQPQKGERWETTWILRKPGGNRHNVWLSGDCMASGENCDVFRLVTVPIGGINNGDGQVLIWQRARGAPINFSINEQSFGMLRMTGNDGDGYLAVRAEGGEEVLVPVNEAARQQRDWARAQKSKQDAKEHFFPAPRLPPIDLNSELITAGELHARLIEVAARINAARINAANLYCRIETGVIGSKGDVLQAVLVTSDGAIPPRNAIWFGIGKRMILPQWYTHGNLAQGIPGDKLQEAWENRTPGVYKMVEPTDGFLNAAKEHGVKVELK